MHIFGIERINATDLKILFPNLPWTMDLIVKLACAGIMILNADESNSLIVRESESFVTITLESLGWINVRIVEI